MITLQNHMQANIGSAIANPIIDGRWHSGKPARDGKGADKISYVGHHLPKGVLVRYRNHKQSDECFVWKEWEGDDNHLSDAEYQQRKAAADESARLAAQQAEAEKARLLAILQTIIKQSKPADHHHPYPLGKRIVAINARQATKRYELQPETSEKAAQYIDPSDLLIPVYSHTGRLQGIQQITAQGRKFARGTFKAGLLWVGGGLSTGEVPNRIYIAEGWATGVAVHMRTRSPVIVAFATSNLLAAGKWARDRYPDAEIVFAVDNDTESFIKVGGQVVNNPGKYYATKAATAINAAVIIPPMAGDWCDWHITQIQGEKKTRQAGGLIGLSNYF